MTAATPPARPRPPAERTAFFVSDGTGITAETFGISVLSQFDGIRIRQVRLPFVDTEDKAQAAVERINRQAEIDGRRSIVFSTLVHQPTNDIVRTANAVFMDLFATFVEPLELELGIKSTHSIGRFHRSPDRYGARIDAINFALSHDDGASHADLAKADVILVGVSRSGKTPTTLYLAMQHGVKAANYPLIPEDFERKRLPDVLYQFRPKLFGLTIGPQRLHEVRTERRPDSRYATLEQCRLEVAQAESMMRREKIAMLSSTTKSIEEIAATILTVVQLDQTEG